MKLTAKLETLSYTFILSTMMKCVSIAFVLLFLLHGGTNFRHDLAPLVGITAFIAAMVLASEWGDTEPLNDLAPEGGR
jgi:hypothetical protein